MKRIEQASDRSNPPNQLKRHEDPHPLAQADFRQVRIIENLSRWAIIPLDLFVRKLARESDEFTIAGMSIEWMQRCLTHESLNNGKLILFLRTVYVCAQRLKVIHESRSAFKPPCSQNFLCKYQQIEMLRWLCKNSVRPKCFIETSLAAYSAILEMEAFNRYVRSM